MLKLKRTVEPVWVDWPDAEGVQLQVRPLSIADSLRIHNEFKSKIVVKDPDDRHRLHFVDDVDAYAMGKALFDYCLVSWRGIEVEGTTRDHEVREALYNHDRLREFVLRTATELNDAREARHEEELKNSSSSQSG